MKHAVTLLLLLIMFATPCALHAEADDGEGKTFSIALYPVPALIGLFSAEGEYALTERLSLAVEAKYLHWDISSDLLGGDWELSILFLGPGLRYYSSRALEGFFIGPYVSYVSSSITYTDDDTGNEGSASLKGWNLALWLGYKAVFGSVFFEISTGLSYLSLNPEVTYRDSSGASVSKSFDYGMGGVYWPGIGIGIGMAF